MCNEKSNIKDDIYFYRKVKDFIALSEEEKSRLAMIFFSINDYLNLRLEEVVFIINQTSKKKYEDDDDWSKWVV